MKNLHIIPTDKPSRLYTVNSIDKLDWSEGYLQQVDGATNQNIYITNDEEIKEGNWCIDDIENVFKIESLEYFKKFSKKIILTDNKDLIKDGIQSIDDEFLQWFVAHPTCEEVKIGNQSIKSFDTGHFEDFYKTIIPSEELLYDSEVGYYTKEEPKQETLEEVIERESEIRYPVLTHSNSSDSPYVGIQKTFKHGVKFGIELQQERSYSEIELFINEVKDKLDSFEYTVNQNSYISEYLDEWFEQFKKK